MEIPTNIIRDWFLTQSAHQRDSLLHCIAASMSHLKNQPVEQMTSQIAAGVMAACAEDLGLSIVELAGLLRTPKQDAIASLVTVLRDA